MEQLWELLGRTSLDNNLLGKIVKVRKKGGKAFHLYVNRPVKGGGLGYRLSRAEMVLMYNLLTFPGIVKRAAPFRKRLRDALKAAGVKEAKKSYAEQENLTEFRTLIGAMFADAELQRAAFEVVDAHHDNKAAASRLQKFFAEHNFSPRRSDLEAFARFYRMSATREDMRAMHDKWVPPDCYDAMTYAPTYVEPSTGGVYLYEGEAPYAKRPDNLGTFSYSNPPAHVGQGGYGGSHGGGHGGSGA